MPTKFEYYKQQAEHALIAGKYSVLRGWLDKMARLCAKDAKEYVVRDKLDDAIAQLVQANWLSPLTASYYHKMAQLLRQVGKNEEAERYEEEKAAVTGVARVKNIAQKTKRLLYRGDLAGFVVATKILYTPLVRNAFEILMNWVENYPKGDPRKIRFVFTRAPIAIAVAAEDKVPQLKEKLRSDKAHVRDTAFRSLVKIQGLQALKKHRRFIRKWENQYAPVSLSLFEEVNTGGLFWETIGDDLRNMEFDTAELIDYIAGIDIDDYPFDYYLWVVQEGLCKALVDHLVRDYQGEQKEAIIRQMEEILIYSDESRVNVHKLGADMVKVATKINNREMFQFLWRLLDEDKFGLQVDCVAKALFGMSDRYALESLFRIMQPQYDSIRKEVLSELPAWENYGYMRHLDRIDQRFSSFPPERDFLFKDLQYLKRPPIKLERFLLNHMSEFHDFLKQAQSYRIKQNGELLKKAKSPQLQQLGDELLALAKSRMITEAQQDDDYSSRREALKSLNELKDASLEPIFRRATESDEPDIVELGVEGLLMIHEQTDVDLYPGLEQVIRREKNNEYGDEDQTCFNATYLLLKHLKEKNHQESLGRLVDHILSSDKADDAPLIKLILKMPITGIRADMEKKLTPRLETCPLLADLMIKQGWISDRYLDQYRALLSHENGDCRMAGARLLGALKDAESIAQIRRILFNRKRLQRQIDYNLDVDRMFFIIMDGQVDPESTAMMHALAQIGSERAINIVLDFALLDLSFLPNLRAAFNVLKEYPETTVMPCLKRFIKWRDEDPIGTRERIFIEHMEEMIGDPPRVTIPDSIIEKLIDGKNRELKKLARKLKVAMRK
ncbi:hypothetical protein JXO59_15670 [candidate division KSB1 bacterium]|nr:hypothetical protein [candidate division KSB1 bacterium]